MELVLRRTVAGDVPLLFAFEQERAGNEMSGGKPREWGVFEARWAEILADADGAGVTPRVIVASGVGGGSVVVGSVNIVRQDGRDCIGYRIGQRYWGRGIATRTVGLLLGEYVKRPVYATAWAGNVASVRVLEKNGFVVESREITPETGRSVRRETVTLVLR